MNNYSLTKIQQNYQRYFKMKDHEFVKESLLHFDAKAQIKPFTERYLIKIK